MAEHQVENIDVIDEIARDTCVGDIRDFMLSHIRDSKEALPWTALSESRQREIIETARSAAERMVARVVKIVAADGKRSIVATLEQFTLKDGVKATVKCGSDDGTVLALNHARGATVQIIVADDSPYTGQRKPAEPMKDEPAMFDQTDAGRDDASPV